MKNYSELIKARLEQVAGAVAQSVKGLIYFRTDTDRPTIDDGTDVSQIMMEKHLPEARQDTPVELANSIALVPIVIDGTNDSYGFLHDGMVGTFAGTIPQTTYATGQDVVDALVTSLTGNMNGATIGGVYNPTTFITTLTLSASNNPRFTGGPQPLANLLGFNHPFTSTGAGNEDISDTPAPFQSGSITEVAGVLLPLNGGTGQSVLTGNAGQVLVVNQAEDGYEFGGVGFDLQAAQDLVNAGTIALAGKRMETFDVTASAGAAVMANAPFGTSPANFKDRAVIVVTCIDSVNPVTINVNNIQYGYVGNGNLVLTQGHQVQFIYNAGLERFLELSRNF